MCLAIQTEDEVQDCITRTAKIGLLLEKKCQDSSRSVGSSIFEAFFVRHKSYVSHGKFYGHALVFL